MSNMLVVGASEARQRFFELISLAQEGKEILVEKKGKPVVRISLPQDKKTAKQLKRQKLAAVRRLAKINLDVNMTWKEMEKIMSDAHLPHF
ncbi:MAG: type II toxin-antitoxin system prevent-host-death family antitoxin [Patescibacteria group bacterium]|nr:type II toxin-antitoxin system prevent-host-death family antitoxin [Patescibacteria group bacterium]